MEDNLYLLVQWPESQDYMDYDWFESEAFLTLDDSVSGSAYFIPLKRVKEVNNDN